MKRETLKIILLGALLGTIPILLGFLLSPYIIKQPEPKVVGYVTYNESYVKAKDLEGKVVMNFCYLVYTGEKWWKCEDLQLINCKSGRCDLVVYRGYVKPDNILKFNFSYREVDIPHGCVWENG